MSVVSFHLEKESERSLKCFAQMLVFISHMLRNDELQPCRTRRSIHLLASTFSMFGSANFTLFLYTAGPLSCKGFASKYTVFNSFLSRSCSSTSSNESSRFEEAHNSSSFVRGFKPERLRIWLFETSRIRRFVLLSRPDISVRALCDMYISSRLGSSETPVILVRRLDWIDRILRFSRCEMFCHVSSALGPDREEEAYVYLDDLILAQPELFQIGQRVQILYLLHKCQSHVFRYDVKPTLILLAASSKFRNLVMPSRPSIFDILFCSRYRSVTSLKWFRFLICLILLKLKSRLVRCMSCSRPLICDIRLSYKSRSCNVGPRTSGN